MLLVQRVSILLKPGKIVLKVTKNKWSLRKVKGVIQIEIDDETATVHIFAETAEAAKKARQVSS